MSAVVANGVLLSIVFFLVLQVYATAGKLVKILLTNFMCHKHLEVTFHDNVNVILGRNGSKLAFNIKKSFGTPGIYTEAPRTNVNST